MKLPKGTTFEDIVAAHVIARNNGIIIPSMDGSKLTEKSLKGRGSKRIDPELADLLKPKTSRKGKASKPKAVKREWRRIINQDGSLATDTLTVLRIIKRLGPNVNRSRVVTRNGLNGLSTERWNAIRETLKAQGYIEQCGERRFAGYSITDAGRRMLDAIGG